MMMVVMMSGIAVVTIVMEMILMMGRGRTICGTNGGGRNERGVGSTNGRVQTEGHK